ncbi:MAG TPA: sn-glycerol-3-phosphate ABC transporter ATP-binding protein UgpC [bacterium (Candidatus Stahlbacteria)]|nr:sn-glycerol-3-phosphate ABC transporter ATP-binding protein UgpC [Candidatus Stahlbacteria bacterium]
MARVVLKDVTKIFDKGTVGVKDITLEVKDREFAVLVGPSGCGKSTTLRLIAGLEEPTAGEIYIGDRLVNDIPPKDRDVAMVFQDYALYPHMTAYENLAFSLKLRRYSRDEIKNRVYRAAEILGIKNLLSRRPKALSGGERQRVALGRAIVRDPKVFLFDEPLSNLDAKLRVQMRAELKKLHNRLNATTIYVTHDQVEAMTLGDKICVLNEGKIQQIGDPLTLYNRPANRFVAGFIGAPPMNFFDGMLRENGIFETKEFSIRVTDKCEESEATLGVRPEDIEIAANDSEVKGIVSVVEPIGSEFFIHVEIGQTAITVRTKLDRELRIGDKINLSFDPQKLHLFDRIDGSRIEFQPHL